jgi:hypothetical protein
MSVCASINLLDHTTDFARGGLAQRSAPDSSTSAMTAKPTFVEAGLLS